MERADLIVADYETMILYLQLIKKELVVFYPADYRLLLQMTNVDVSVLLMRVFYCFFCNNIANIVYLPFRKDINTMRIRLTELKRIIRSEVRRALHESGDSQEVEDMKADIEAAIKAADPEEIEDALQKLGEGRKYSKIMKEYVGGGAGGHGLSVGMIAAAVAAFGFDVDTASAGAIFLATAAGTAWLVDKLEKAGLYKA